MSEDSSSKTNTSLIKSARKGLFVANKALSFTNKLAGGEVQKYFNEAFCLLNGFTENENNYLFNLQNRKNYRKNYPFSFIAKKYEDYTAAIELFNKVIALKPDHYLAYDFRGIARVKIGDISGGILDFGLSSIYNSKYQYAYLNCGNAYDDKGEYRKAIENYDAAIAIDIEFAQAYNARANCRSKIKNHKDALLDYNKAIAIDPNYAVAYYNRGITHKHLKNLEASMDDYNKAIDLDPKFAHAFNGRGNVKTILGDTQAAGKDFESAAKNDKNFASYYKTLGTKY